MAGCGEDPAAPGNVSTTATAIVIVSGDLQDGVAGATAAVPLTVKVTASGGVGMSGKTVQFAVTAGAATVATGPTGEATATLVLGAAPGTVEVRATVAGTSLSAAFHATILAPEPDSTSAPQVYNPDWTEASHGTISPGYTTIFPQTVVNTIEVSLTSGQWASVRANMTSLFGHDFGQRAGAPGGDRVVQPLRSLRPTGHWVARAAVPPWCGRPPAQRSSGRVSG